MNFKYNADVKYKQNGSYSVKTQPYNLNDLEIVVNDKGGQFDIKTLDVFDSYTLPRTTSDATVDRWMKTPMQFYQNQIHFAIWCASAGCGVSWDDHLNHSNPLIRSVFRFHFYYQIRRILNELEAPLSEEKSFNILDNPYNKMALKKLQNEFGVTDSADFRQQIDRNHGLGDLWLHPRRSIDDSIKPTKIPDQYVSGLTVLDYRPYFANTSSDTYIDFQRANKWPIDYIEQTVSNGWLGFIPDKGLGFTRPGLARLDDSIRNYVWTILGAQVQARASIVGSGGTNVDSQKQFLANLEDAIHSPVDIGESIKRYEDVLMYARSKVDYVVGINLYMLPSDLELQIGTIKNYNNKIVIATAELSIGKNDGVNEDTGIIFNKTTDKPATVETKKTLIVADPIKKNSSREEQSKTLIVADPIKKNSSREEQGKALIVAGTIIGIFALWWRK